MICDKVIYGVQSILTIYHLGLDKDVPKRRIEKTIKTANIYEARNSTIATLKLMNMYL